MSSPATTTISRIAEYADGIQKAAKPLRCGDINIQAAENMLVDAMCLQAALTAFLMRCDLQREKE